MNIDWKYQPGAPEFLIGEREHGPIYLYKCIGNVPAGDDEKGDLLRVWVPDESTPFNKRVVEELEEKHGVYAEDYHEAKEKFDQFTPLMKP